jgi:GNAT superfamily N-acetyltransferase
MDNVTISTDPALLDIPWICASLRGSYWGGHLVDGQVRAALAKSLVFGAYADGKQIGVVRVVTDGAIFSSVTDVFVDEAHRGKGVGSALMEAVVKHEAVKGTYCILRARQEAWLFYFRTGDFHVFDRKSGLMHRMPQ